MYLMTSQCFDVTNVTKKWWDVGEHCVSKYSFIPEANQREYGRSDGHGKNPSLEI